MSDGLVAAPVPVRLAPTLQGVDHVAIAVRDIVVSLRFFSEQLGFAVVHDELLENQNVRLVYLDTGNVTLQLAQPIGPGRIATFLADHGEGLHHICLRVDRIATAVTDLELGAHTEVFMGGRGRPACFLVEEQSGVVVELTEASERSLR